MKKYFLFFALSLLYCFSFSQVRQHISLDDDWKFHFDHAAMLKKILTIALPPFLKNPGKQLVQP